MKKKKKNKKFLKLGLDEEGLFRVPGSTIKVNNLKQMYNSG